MKINIKRNKFHRSENGKMKILNAIFLWQILLRLTSYCLRLCVCACLRVIVFVCVSECVCVCVCVCVYALGHTLYYHLNLHRSPLRLPLLPSPSSYLSLSLSLSITISMHLLFVVLFLSFCNRHRAHPGNIKARENNSKKKYGAMLGNQNEVRHRFLMPSIVVQPMLYPYAAFQVC